MPEKKKNIDKTLMSKLVEKFELYRSRPIIITEDQAFGDDNDSLKAKFHNYQKKLHQEKTFREYLADIIDRKGIVKYSEVYKAAGVSKYTFSKIMNFNIEPPHKPSEATVAALVIGLKLDMREAEAFYNVAGYVLGESEFLDTVIRFFIDEGEYTLIEVNGLLNYFGYPQLGEKAREEKR
jgi:hypothetical protein